GDGLAILAVGRGVDVDGNQQIRALHRGDVDLAAGKQVGGAGRITERLIATDNPVATVFGCVVDAVGKLSGDVVEVVDGVFLEFLIEPDIHGVDQVCGNMCGYCHWASPVTESRCCDRWLWLKDPRLTHKSDSRATRRWRPRAEVSSTGTSTSL